MVINRDKEYGCHSMYLERNSTVLYLNKNWSFYLAVQRLCRLLVTGEPSRLLFFGKEEINFRIQFKDHSTIWENRRPMCIDAHCRCFSQTMTYVKGGSSRPRNNYFIIITVMGFGYDFVLHQALVVTVKTIICGSVTVICSRG